jgi:hypothetical protein
MAHRARAYPYFCSIKLLGVSLIQGEMLVHHILVSQLRLASTYTPGSREASRVWWLGQGDLETVWVLVRFTSAWVLVGCKHMTLWSTERQNATPHSLLLGSWWDANLLPSGPLKDTTWPPFTSVWVLVGCKHMTLWSTERQNATPHSLLLGSWWDANTWPSGLLRDKTQTPIHFCLGPGGMRTHDPLVYWKTKRKRPFTSQNRNNVKNLNTPKHCLYKNTVSTPTERMGRNVVSRQIITKKNSTIISSYLFCWISIFLLSPAFLLDDLR